MSVPAPIRQFAEFRPVKSSAPIPSTDKNKTSTISTRTPANNDSKNNNKKKNSDEEVSASELMRRRMEAMTLRDAKEAEERRLAKIEKIAEERKQAKIVKLATTKKEDLIYDDDGDDDEDLNNQQLERELDDDEIESAFPSYSEEDRIHERKPKGSFSTQIRVPKNCIGAVIGIGGSRIRSIKSIPGIISLNYSKESGILQFVAANQSIHDKTKQLIEAYVDRTWVGSDQPAPEEPLKLYRKYISAPRSDVKKILDQCRNLSCRTGITRILIEPIDPENPKRKTTSFMAEGPSERAVSEVINALSPSITK